MKIPPCEAQLTSSYQYQEQLLLPTLAQRSGLFSLAPNSFPTFVEKEYHMFSLTFFSAKTALVEFVFRGHEFDPTIT